MADTQAGALELTTADLAASAPAPLFSEPEMGKFRSRSSDVQTRFVDEPRRSVEHADTPGQRI